MLMMLLVKPIPQPAALLDQPVSMNHAFGAAMTPVLFAYGSWRRLLTRGEECSSRRALRMVICEA
jgi:hypothetical protein